MKTGEGIDRITVYCSYMRISDNKVITDKYTHYFKDYDKYNHLPWAGRWDGQGKRMLEDQRQVRSYISLGQSLQQTSIASVLHHPWQDSRNLHARCRRENIHRLGMTEALVLGPSQRLLLIRIRGLWANANTLPATYTARRLEPVLAR